MKLSCLGVEQRCTRKKELRALTESQENLRLAVAIARAAPAQHSRPGAAVRWLCFLFWKPNKLQFETRDSCKRQKTRQNQNEQKAVLSTGLLRRTLTTQDPTRQQNARRGSASESMQEVAVSRDFDGESDAVEQHCLAVLARWSELHFASVDVLNGEVLRKPG